MLNWSLEKIVLPDLMYISRFTDLLGPPPPDDGPIPVPVDQGPLPVPVDEALPLVPNNEGEVDGRAFGADLVGAFDHHTGL